MNSVNFTIRDNNKLNISNNISNTCFSKLCNNIYTFNSGIIDTKYYSANTTMYNLYKKALILKKNDRITESIKVFEECEHMITKTHDKDLINIYYEVYVNLGLLMEQTIQNFDKIKFYYTKVISLCPDRCEPYFYFSIYCNRISKYDVSYKLLHTALPLTYENVKKKYKYIQSTAYGKHLYYELSIACNGLKKYDEGIKLLEDIKDDIEYSYNFHNIHTQLQILKSLI
jgi:tetratricopeptide (TPR) repeat protein